MTTASTFLNPLSLLVVSALASYQTTHAFQSVQYGRARSKLTALNVLTPRQLQFWEDVDDGLDDVEKFYEAKGQSMERIRTFCQRARGDLPLPEPAAPGHQPSEEHIDGLTAKAFWDVSSNAEFFPWAEKLEENAHIIADEFKQQLLPTKEEADDSALFSGDSAWQSKVMGTGWSAFRLQRLGVWNVENCAKFPKTYDLLKELDIPLAVRGVCFARQTPGSGVAPHTDGRNFILTSHLGLKIPEDCWIKVGEEQQTWSEGKLTTLDTSFEHSTGNPSSEDRHVLIIDFWHPELSDAERAGLEFIYDLRNKFESGEVPFRQPRAKEPVEEEGQGLGGIWKALTGGGD
eukprot:CAMPEP_0183703464 /NCGR_PEP_ID=MMETSP0737-20130205/1200_1 /TAXON_ID=385413 /ORGANISM="Thalassiosira miniscula, Strain CCMP1093" /LENGTH=345 /DNA_ID=CAMNT_0025930223 /DNA_START=101 /DNA_END=1138 /DNA_ORIENTATION=+